MPRKKIFIPAERETVRDSSIFVAEPTAATEFEVQAFLWSELRKLGINARGEVKCRFAGRAQVRFDLAVFSEGRLVGLIECKREDKQCKTDWSETRQGNRYLQFGVPVLLIHGMPSAMTAIERAKAGRLWDAA